MRIGVKKVLTTKEIKDGSDNQIRNGLKECEVDEIEDIMRHDIFHSTLDWQTKEELEEAAVLAYLALKEIEDE